MRDIHPEIRRRGAELVVVGNGSPDQGAAFRREAALAFPLFVDPKLIAYAAAGLRRGLSTVLRPRVFRRAFHAWRANFRQRGVAGDPWQQGGLFVIHPGGIVSFAFVSRAAGDHADPHAVLEALAGCGKTAAG